MIEEREFGVSAYEIVEGGGRDRCDFELRCGGRVWAEVLLDFVKDCARGWSEGRWFVGGELFRSRGARWSWKIRQRGSDSQVRLKRDGEGGRCNTRRREGQIAAGSDA